MEAHILDTFILVLINRLKRIVRGKLVKMIKGAGSKFDDYSISPQIRQILLHWGYELTEIFFFNELTNQRIKMSYYWFNRQEILQKEKERYFKHGSNKRKVKRAL